MTDGRTPSRNWQAHPPTRTVYSREWRASNDRQPDRMSRKSKLRAVIIGLVIIVGVIGVLLAPSYNSPLPIQIVTFGIGVYGGRANPQGNLPVNPFGEQDAKAFQVLSDIHPTQFLPVRQEDNVLNGAQFLTFLRKEAQDSGLSGKCLIVFCTMHAVVLPTGGIELFAIDALPDSPGSSSGKMIPLQDLMTCLQESMARKVVLILDLARLESNWRMGILNNDLAAQISAEWASHENAPGGPSSSAKDKVTILISAGPGQKSWSANRNSAFVRYVVDGLAGAADGWVSNPKPGDNAAHDNRVSLKELQVYTKHHINDWATRHFGTSQTSVLLGNATDFELATVSPKYQGSNPISDALAVKSQIEEKKPEAAVETAIEGKPPADAAQPGEDKPSLVDSTKPPAADDGAAKKPGKPSAEVNWTVKLADLRKARDSMNETGGRTRHEVCRVNPLLWRTFEARLAFAGALEQGGTEELVPQVVQQADLAYQKLNGRMAALGTIELQMSEANQQVIKDLGFGQAVAMTPEVYVAVEKFVVGLAKDAKAAAANPAPPAKETPDPNPIAIQEWLKRELRKDGSANNWTQLRLTVELLEQAGKLPTTDDCQFLRGLLTADDAAERFSRGDALQRMFTLKDRLRKLAMNSPESVVLCRAEIDSTQRSLYSSEQWMLATSSSNTNVREWLDKAEKSIGEIELTTRRYSETIGVWSDLIAELPQIAEWIATRANNDEKRKPEWSKLRDVARRWADSERDGKWDVETLRNQWYDKPARLTDLERLLLAQFAGAQKLKRTVLSAQANSSAGPLASEELLKVATQALRDRSDFWEEFRRTFPRLGTADYPTPLLWYEANQLLSQPWITAEERRKLVDLQQLEPRGDVLADRSAESQSLWQGFWGIATLGLLTNPEESEELTALWKNWDRLAELSQAEPNGSATSAEQESLRKRRAELGRTIRQQWSTLQSRAQAAKGGRSIPRSHLIAATLDPTTIPEVDPDNVIRNERRKQFIDWLSLYAADWRYRATSPTNTAKQGYAKLAEKVDGILSEVGATPSRSPLPARVTFQQVSPPRFDATRKSTLDISITGGSSDASNPLKLNLIGSRIRLLDGNKAGNSQTATRTVPADGQMKIPVQLDEDVDTPQAILLVLTEPDGAPIEYQKVLLHPPFDGSQWRIEFVDAATGTPLENVPLSGAVGMKFFLPPSASMAIKANLFRPAKDLSPSAKINLFGLTESGKMTLAADLNLTLEPGKERTPIPLDIPLPPKEKEPAAPKEKAPEAPVADLARGMVFEITPEGQSPIVYRVQPTFWSAAKFINDPQPVIRDDRFSLDLERRPVSGEDVLLPKKIAVELNLPDTLRNSLTEYALGGSIAIAKKQTLSFKLPKNWSDLARDQNWNVTLDVAGLPHPYRWRIEPTGLVTPITGQPPQLNIRLILPPAGPKAPPRLEPILLQGKDPLHLVFQVDSTELDRSEELGDWSLGYTVVRAGDSGYEPTPLQNSWRLFSSVQRHILLDGIKAGTWNIRTQALNYERVEAESDVRGLSGRFQVQATLTRSKAPNLPLASAKLQFAIDDDAPPNLEVRELSLEPRNPEKEIRCRVDATDLESGIQGVAFGFDKNGDKQLQPEEESIDQRTFVPLDNTKVAWQIVIPRSMIPKIEKDEETRNLIFTAKNGLGIPVTRVFPITFRKPALPKKATTGTLVVSMKISRGAKSTIQISGPTSRLENDVATDSFTFTELPPGQYTINVKTNYAVIGRKDEGEAKVEVKVGQSITAPIPLSVAKPK